MKMMRWLYILIVFFNLNAKADFPLEVQLTLGFGRAKFKVISPVDFLENEQVKIFLNELEVATLTNEVLAPLVTGNQNYSYQFISGINFDELNSDLQVQEWIQVILAKAQADIPKKGSISGVVSEGKRKVVMGSHLVVSENEELDEVVVIAGSADIRGTVKKLVLIGGEVHLFSTAVILEELNTIGGHLSTDKGASVKGKSVNVGLPLSDESWLLILRKLKNSNIGQFLKSDMTAFLMTLLKIVSIMLFSFLGNYIAPMYFKNIAVNIRERPGSSFFWGFISLFMVIPIVILLAISIIGIPLMPLQFSLYFIFFVLGYAQSAQFIVVLLSKIHSSLRINNAFLSIFLGILLFEFISLIPYFGAFLKWSFIIMGFGSASRVFYKYLFLPPSEKLTLKASTI
jgi:hypothetical protein